MITIEVTAALLPLRVQLLKMHLGRQLVVAVAIVAMLAGAGCKKKSKTVPPTVAPTISVPPPEPEPPPTPPPVLTSPLPNVKQPVPKKPKVKAHKPKKTAVPPASAEKPEPPKTVVENTTKPADSNVQITAEVPQGAANQRRQQAEDLLQAAESNLRRISRPLSDGEQAMQRQVRNFITQSRLAIQDNDIERAYNLANKANLLSQELVK